MQGLEVARAFYEEHGRPMLERDFSQRLPDLAIGLAGQGSECSGFDDEISRDHDFSPGFVIWVPDDMDESTSFRLSAAYDRLPREFLGYPVEHRSRMGDGRKGVKTIGGFYRQFTGLSAAPTHWTQWLQIPSWALEQATNGEVWRDDLGAFSAIRETLLHGMPEDVRLKKLAARAALMAQSGQYNYARCLRHGEIGAAALALSEFVRETTAMVYLLNRSHMPYYKWVFRGMKQLPVLGALAPRLEALLLNPRDAAEEIEAISLCVIQELQSQGLTNGSWDYLEPHAMEIQRKIKDPEIRALHLMEG